MSDPLKPKSGHARHDTALIHGLSASEVQSLSEACIDMVCRFHPGMIGNATSTFKQYNVIAADLVAKVCSHCFPSVLWFTRLTSSGKIPPNITVDQAAAIPLCLGTAALGLYAKRGNRGGAGLTPPWEEGGRGKYNGQPILVFGGSSSVGQYGKGILILVDVVLIILLSSVIQLAKLSGFSPIITTSSLAHADYLKSLGATYVLDRNAPLTSI